MRKSLIIILILTFSAIAVIYFVLPTLMPTNVTMRGSMFVSDEGRSHGGFEYNAEWNAILNIKGSTGILNLTLSIGLGDALQKHEYSLSDLKMDQNRISMKIDGEQVILVWVESDEIWDHSYDKYYIASWGSDSPPNEIRGTISPTMFPGLYPGYYVELRLK